MLTGNFYGDDEKRQRAPCMQWQWPANFCAPKKGLLHVNIHENSVFWETVKLWIQLLDSHGIAFWEAPACISHNGRVMKAR